MSSTQIYVYVYAILIELFIIIYTLKYHTVISKTQKLFIVANVSILFLLLFEGMSWFLMDYNTIFVAKLNYVLISLTFALNYLPIILYFAYFDQRALYDNNLIKKREKIYLLFILLMIVVTILNIFTGILFGLTSDNIYTRGIGMYLSSILALVFTVLYFISLLPYLKSVEGRLINIMLAFSFFPVIGAIIQSLFYGVPAIWSMFALFSFFILIFVEREDILRDSLTNLVTRGQFEQRLKYKLSKKVAFSILMIDLDKFKNINDTYGHDEGDIALITTSNILRNTVRHFDTVSRYGGDEFQILLESDQKNMGQKIKERILSNISNYNSKKIKPYKIQLSIGVLFVEESFDQNFFHVLKSVDMLMYNDKLNKD